MESYDHHKSASQIFRKACGYGSHRIVCPELPLPSILDVCAATSPKDDAGIA